MTADRTIVDPGRVPELDLERIRAAGERHFARAVLQHPDATLIAQLRAPADPQHVRRALLANALRLGVAMAPGAYAAAHRAQAVLGVTGEIEIYQRRGAENAAIHLVPAPILLEVQGSLLSLLDEGALTGLFGHELGHHLCHGATPAGHGPADEALRTAHAARVALSSPDLDPRLRDDLSALSMFAELTADRFGLLACQDLHAMLRLEMVALTGLSGGALTWDTEVYLAQCRELIDGLLAARARGEDGAVYGGTHPEHSVRAYALWLFSETDVFRRLTGRGPGTRTLEEVDAELLRLFTDAPLDAHEPGYHLQDAPPPELHECALAACVIVAHADGDFSGEEAEAIERIFAPLVPDWQSYLSMETALLRFRESADVVAMAGADLRRALLQLLVHVMGADGVIHPDEIGAILAIGEALGCGDVYRRSLVAAVGALAGAGALDVAAAEPLALPLPARAADIDRAWTAFAAGVRRRGAAVITLRRLLRIAGRERPDPDTLRWLADALERATLTCEPPVLEAALDDRLRLTAPATAPAARPAPVDDATRDALRVALTRLRDQLVSGDGRSPSVRLRRVRTGRAFDLHDLAAIATGADERCLQGALSGSATPLVRAADAGAHRPAQQCAAQLLALHREHRARLEETGANDLYLGTPFLTGNVAGYLVRGPLLLHPTELVQTAQGARGFELRPRPDETPSVNQSLLRVVFNKRGLALPDALLDELDAIASDPAGGLPAVLGKLREVGLKFARAEGAPLGPLRERDDEFLERDDFLEIEECAVLGLFPQSSSDLLQDYDGLIHDLQDPKTSVDSLFAAASVLLPDALVPKALEPSALEPNASDASPAASSAQPRPPVIVADPTQRRVIEACRAQLAMVVDGPPGTGKSQVIANLVADALARGQRVAVVCEKRAALDVVHQRLGGLGLQHLMGLVHDVHHDRRALYDQIADRIEGFAPSRTDAAERARVDAEHTGACARLQAELAWSARRDERGGCTLGQLAATVAARPADVLPELVAALGGVDRPGLDALTRALPELYRLRDLLAPERGWFMGERGSIAAWSAADRDAWAATLDRAADAADVHEAALADNPGVDPGAVEEAAPHLDAALAASDARRDHAAALPPLLAGAGHDTLAAEAALAKEQSPAMLAYEAPMESVPLAPEETAALSVVHANAGRFLRFFLFAWWRSRGVVRRALARVWPERAGAPLGADLLDELLRRARATAGWGAARRALEAVGEAAPARADAALARLDALLAAMPLAADLAGRRAALSRAAAWPDDAERLAGWDDVLGARQRLARSRVHLRQRVADARGPFAAMPELPDAASLRALAARVREDGARLQVLDQLLDGLGARRAVGLTLAQHLAPTARPLAGWLRAVERSFAASCFADAERADGDVAQLGSAARDAERDRTAARLAALETERAELEVEHVLAAADGARLLNVPVPEPRKRRTEDQKQREFLLKETRKKRRLLPLRSFVRRFAEDVLDIVPVWLLSPETMAVLFPRTPLFDLVVFDEASQCTVESGLPVLLRAKRVVIAGDEKQMPPSSYFQLGSSDDEDADEAQGEADQQLRDMLSSESLLTLASTRVAHAGLQWHYRCHRESLIAFSNHAMYGGALRTIPATAGPAAPPVLRWVDVPDGAYQAGVNLPEAERVVDLVDELLQRPEPPSVGVVTFNLKQRRAVMDALDARVAADAAFAERWGRATERVLDERPFVKNLEQVQGDERDVILFSLGHAPVERKRRGVPTGERYVPARFGPLGQRGGERRLNVAVSRAKRECVVVASFHPSLLGVASAKHAGPRLFKHFLEFAHATGGGRQQVAARVLDLVREARSALAAPVDARPPLPGHVSVAAQIAEALEARRVPIELAVGASDFRVPLAVLDPADPTRFRLAVLVDEGDPEPADPPDPFGRFVHEPAVLRMRGWDVAHVSAFAWMRRPDAVIAELVARVPGCVGAADSPAHRAAQQAAPVAPPAASVSPAPAKRPTIAEPAPRPAWLDAIADPLHRRALQHLDENGALDETVLRNLLGGPRKARLFHEAWPALQLAIPFEVAVDDTPAGRSYAKR